MAYSTSSAEGASSVATADAAGNNAAMWAEFAARLRVFVARRVPPGTDPDDVVQEVFLRAVRHLPSLRDDQRIEAWFFQIARNTLVDAVRMQRRRDSRTDPLDFDVPAEADGDDLRAAEAELAPCLAPMISRLAEPYRTAVELTSLQGLTQAEAAKRVGVSVSGMKSRVQRAREQLKQTLLQCCQLDVDRRGGVFDYLPKAAACGNSSGKAGSACGCARGGCSPNHP